jgi:hypothetical protein
MRLPTYIVFVALWVASGAFAGEMSGTCPGIIPASSIKPDKPVSDWMTVVPGQMHLKGAGMMGSPPERRGYLVPDSDTKTTQTYTFAKGEERWLFCDYGAVELARKVGGGGTKCVITTKTKKPENNLSASVVCE